MKDAELIALAMKARQKAYAPYSHYLVGAALLTSSGQVYTGANVENASYGLTNCAERVAIQSAVSAGEKRISAVAVFSPDIKGITPCGACRQVMAEFSTPASPGLLIIIEGKRGLETLPLAKLLPRAFHGKAGGKG